MGPEPGCLHPFDLARLGTFRRDPSCCCKREHGAFTISHLDPGTEHYHKGYIATCSRDRLWLHTINARPIVSLDLSDAAPSPLYPPVTSIAFLERDYSSTDLIATGAPDGTITLRTWNANSTPEGEKAQWKFVTLKTLKVKSESRFRSSIPCVTALRFVGYVYIQQ